VTQHSRDTPQFYLTAPSPCPYLGGKEERKVFTHLVGERAGELNNILTHGGFRRSQSIAYRPACEGCRACVSVRVVVDDFRPTRGMRRIVKRNEDISGKGTICVVSAGTSDIPVAEEALLTARMMGNCVEHLYDVGVAGIHRLLEHRAKLTTARVIICIAGMEGALPSVVGGLVAAPVIAVPTSTGYGASFGGVAALLGMLNSCASSVSVVNIDNGFGAACVASCINRL